MYVLWVEDIISDGARETNYRRPERAAGGNTVVTVNLLVTWVWTTWVPLYTGIFNSEYYITTWLNFWMWRALYKLFRLTPLLYKGHLYIFGCRGFQAEGVQVQRPWGGVCLKVCGESKVKLQRSGLRFMCRARVAIWDHSKMAACFLACQTSECHHLTYSAPCHLYTFPRFY